MTNHEYLDNLREKLIEQESDPQIREMKEKTLFFLMNQRNYEGGKLKSNFAVPKYQVEKKFLTQVLKEMGYSAKYKEEYDSYYKSTCYIITL